MASRTIGGDTLRVHMQDIPTEHFRELFKKNMPRSANVLRKKALRKIKRRLDSGIEGAGYDEEYARRKSKMKLRNYNTQGPVDLEFSGQLKSALRMVAQVDKGKGIIDMRLTFKPNSRRAFKRSPNATPRGGGITNQRLGEILNDPQNPRGKWGTGGAPFSLWDREREAVIQDVAEELIKT